MTTPSERTLAAVVERAFPGWRAWRQPDGVLAARRGGWPPAGAHARGATLGELLRAVKAASAPAPNLPPTEATALAALPAAAGPRTARQVSGASGLPTSTAVKALASRHARGLSPAAAGNVVAGNTSRCPGPPSPGTPAARPPMGEPSGAPRREPRFADGTRRICPLPSRPEGRCHDRKRGSTGDHVKAGASELTAARSVTVAEVAATFRRPDMTVYPAHAGQLESIRIGHSCRTHERSIRRSPRLPAETGGLT